MHRRVCRPARVHPAPGSGGKNTKGAEIASWMLSISRGRGRRGDRTLAETPIPSALAPDAPPQVHQGRKGQGHHSECQCAEPEPNRKLNEQRLPSRCVRITAQNAAYAVEQP